MIIIPTRVSKNVFVRLNEKCFLTENKKKCKRFYPAKGNSLKYFL